MFGIGDPYISTDEADAMVAYSEDGTPVEVLRETYHHHFIKNGIDVFETHLFHFLLSHLGKQKDKYAVDSCLSLLGIRPEETTDIIKYFRSVDALDEVEMPLLSYINSGEAVYPYQIFTMLEWMTESTTSPTSGFRSLARRLAYDEAQQPYVRSIARKFIGNFGTHAELERLLQTYGDARNVWERAEIICNIRRMEKSRRNAFYGQVKNEDDLIDRAAKYAKERG